MAHHAEFDNELVDQLLGKCFIDFTVCQIIFNKDVEERRNVTQRHGCTVLFFYSGQIGHVHPLYGFLCGSSRTTEIESVIFAHYLNIFQSLDLLCHFFTQANAVISHRTGQIVQIFHFGFDEAVDTVKGQTTVVTDDTSAGIVIGKSGEETQ